MLAADADVDGDDGSDEGVADAINVLVNGATVELNLGEVDSDVECARVTEEAVAGDAATSASAAAALCVDVGICKAGAAGE